MAWVGSESSGPWDKGRGGAGLKKILFRPFGRHFGLKKSRNTKIALTRRKRFKTAWDAGKQQRIQQDNKVSLILFKNMTFFLSFKKNRLHPTQAFVNNRLKHNTARKQESRPRLGHL